MELRSPDPTANPYIAYALLIYAGLYGIRNQLELPVASNINLFTADENALAQYEMLPLSLSSTAKRAAASQFIRAHLPKSLVDVYCRI